MRGVSLVANRVFYRQAKCGMVYRCFMGHQIGYESFIFIYGTLAEFIGYQRISYPSAPTSTPLFSALLPPECTFSPRIRDRNVVTVVKPFYSIRFGFLLHSLIFTPFDWSKKQIEWSRKPVHEVGNQIEKSRNSHTNAVYFF